jgi:hypothetical protein
MNACRIFASVAGFAILTILVSPAAAESDKDSTALYVGTTEKGYKVYYPVANGRLWQRIDLQSTMFVLEGADNGEYLLFLQVGEASKQGGVSRAVMDGLFTNKIENFRLSEIAEQIDMFFKDSANRQIPVIEAYRYVAKRIKGSSPRELDELASTLRKNYYQKEAK